MSREDKVEEVLSEVKVLRALIDNVLIQGVTGARDPVLVAAAATLQERLRSLEQLKDDPRAP